MDGRAEADRLPLQNFWQALQRSAGAASTCLHCSGLDLMQHGASALANIQRRRSPLVRGGLPFASLTASQDATEPTDGKKQRRKKSKKSKASEGVTFSAAQELGNDMAPASAASNSNEPTATTPNTAAPGKVSKSAEAKQPQTKPAAAKKPPARPEMTPGQIYRRWLKMYGGIRTEVNGRLMSLKKLAARSQEQKKFKEIGGDVPGIRKKSRNEIMQNLPGWKLRPWAEKMQLRPHEHFALPLDLWGKGHVLSPERFWGFKRGGQHDFSWGIYGRNEQAQQIFANKYAGRDPREVLSSQEFYNDLMKRAHHMELTAMLVAERPLPLAEARDAFLKRQSYVLRQIPGDPHHIKPGLKPSQATLLRQLRRTYTEESLKRSGLLDEEGRIKENSKLILTITPEYHITAEAITPGTLKEQRPVFLGHCKDRHFAHACMEQFLGRFPLDQRGKASVGNGALYVTNGFNFMPPELSGNPNQFYLDHDKRGKSSVMYPVPEVSLIPARAEIFDLGEEVAPLVNGIGRMRFSAA